MTTIKTEYVGNKNEDNAIDLRWWKMPTKTMHHSIFTNFRRIEQNQIYRRQMNQNYMRLYNGMPPVAYNSNQYQVRNQQDILMANRMTINVIKSCIDTATSKIGTMKTRPFFLTTEGNWGQQQRAEKLTSFFDGLYDELKFYEKSRKQFTDGCIFYAGFIKFFIDPIAKKIKCERVLPNEIVCDDLDGVYGEPATLYQVKLVDRQVMIEKYPKLVNEILKASAADPQQTGYMVNSDMIPVIEAWHLKSGEESKDGCHAIAIEGSTLFMEEWKKDYFPFTKYTWGQKPYGYWGFPMTEELVSMQLDINKTCRVIQLSQHLVAIPKVFVEEGSNVNVAHLNNDVGAVCKYRGTPPIFATPQALSPEMYMHLENQIRRSYEIVGLSQMETQGVKPAGLNSEPSLRTYQDIGSERFKNQATRLEECQMASVPILFDLLDELSEDGAVEVSSPSKKAIKKIKWKDVRVDKKDFVLQVYPTNFLPKTPEGRIEKVIELVKNGLIPQEHVRTLLDFPDLDSIRDLTEANRDIILKIINGILEDGKYETPEPYYNLMLAQKLAQESYLNAKIDNYPEDRLEMLRTFMDNTASMLKMKAQTEQSDAMAVEMMAQQKAQSQMTPPAPLPEMVGKQTGIAPERAQELEQKAISELQQEQSQ